MKKDDKGRVIEPGDIVTIKTNDKEYTGEVLSADYWGAKSGWYIELVWGEKGYFYYKQEFDGGDIIKIVKKSQQAENIYVLDLSNRYNHGCTAYVVFQDRRDGTAICIKTKSCNNCWQVGHNDTFVYTSVGDVIATEKLLRHPDLVREQPKGGIN